MLIFGFIYNYLKANSNGYNIYKNDVLERFRKLSQVEIFIFS